ncbi:MAG: lysophospholipid acyltransferase family protein [Endomicrobium sp.]|jgi:KDO2-lipid IV(A) lauroyltransferase|nr:lysophospholipid acyltransferase family protein [Endomicrobium sp.]
MLNFTKIRRRCYYYGALIFSKAVLFIPYKLSVGYFSKFFGVLAYLVAIDGKNIAKKNIKRCFPQKTDSEIRKLIIEIFINEAKNFFELAYFPKMDSKFLNSISTVENVDLLKKSLKKGNGVLLVSAHAGNWEIAAASISALGSPLNVVAKKIYIDELNDMLVHYRAKKKVKVILKERSDTGIKLLRALKRGEIIALLIDQDTNVPGVFVDFFGQKTWTPSGLAVMALKSKADILLVLDQREDKYNHKTIIKGPLTIESSGDFNTDVKNLTQKASLILEKHIKQYPSQWVWFHDRWKTRPKEENNK